MDWEELKQHVEIALMLTRYDGAKLEQSLGNGGFIRVWKNDESTRKYGLIRYVRVGDTNKIRVVSVVSPKWGNVKVYPNQRRYFGVGNPANPARVGLVQAGVEVPVLPATYWDITPVDEVWWVQASQSSRPRKWTPKEGFLDK